MRTVTVALLAGLGSALAPLMLPVTLIEARAADLDYGVLRGPEYEPAPQVINWSGGYFGAQGGYSSSTADFKNAYKPLVRSITAYSTAESDFSASTMLSPRSQGVAAGSFGGYAGYNYSYDNIVLGMEVDYTRFDRTIITNDSIARFKTNSLGYIETVDIDGSASRRIEDYGTIRARAGYAIDNFLPFVTAGVAIGRVQVVDRVSVRDYGYDQAAYKANQALTTGNGSPTYVNNFGYASFSQTNPGTSIPAAGTVAGVNKTKIVGGITLGAGVEYALTSNIVLRGEYQYVVLNDFGTNPNYNQATITNQNGWRGGIGMTMINTVRGGAAIKF